MVECDVDMSPARPERECPELADPEHGQVSYTGRHFQVMVIDVTAAGSQEPGPYLLSQDRATYSCDEGFTIVGVATVSCQASGRWSGSAPACREWAGGAGTRIPGDSDNIIVNVRNITILARSGGRLARVLRPPAGGGPGRP